MFLEKDERLLIMDIFDNPDAANHHPA